MRTKSDSIQSLLEGIEQAKRERKFDIAADLHELREQYTKLSRRAYLKLLDALIEKYETEEAAAVHAALVEKARGGDLAAIRLYRESQAETGSKGGVIIVDSI
ncbi:MAG: hypothetical protein NC311_08945 [Muribaculaceae bacterium]|nr:hypothetical protein [Muribaculaceae bacterium]